MASRDTIYARSSVAADKVTQAATLHRSVEEAGFRNVWISQIVNKLWRFYLSSPALREEQIGQRAGMTSATSMVMTDYDRGEG